MKTTLLHLPAFRMGLGLAVCGWWLDAAGGRLMAQDTNANSALIAPPPAPQPAAGLPVEFLVKSDLGSFDFAEHAAVYDGHVLVKDPRLKLTCEHMTAKLAPKGGKIENIVAVTNVVIDFTDEKGQAIHATAGRAIYTYDEVDGKIKDILQLMENPVLKIGTLVWTGEAITYNRGDGKVSVVNSEIRGKGNPGIASPELKK